MSAVDEANAERLRMFMRNLENRMKEMELTLAHLAEMLMVTGTAAYTVDPDGEIKVCALNPIDAPVEDC